MKVIICEIQLFDAIQTIYIQDIDKEEIKTIKKTCILDFLPNNLINLYDKYQAKEIALYGHEDYIMKIVNNIRNHFNRKDISISINDILV